MVTNEQHARIYFRMRDAEDLAESQAKLLRELHQANDILRRKLATANETIFTHAYDKR